MAEWLEFSPFDSYFPSSSHVVRNFFFFFKLTERLLKCACHSVNWMVSDRWLKCDWKTHFPSPFSRLKGEISFCDSFRYTQQYHDFVASARAWLYKSNKLTRLRIYQSIWLRKIIMYFNLYLFYLKYALQTEHKCQKVTPLNRIN